MRCFWSILFALAIHTERVRDVVFDVGIRLGPIKHIVGGVMHKRNLIDLRSKSENYRSS